MLQKIQLSSFVLQYNIFELGIKYLFNSVLNHAFITTRETTYCTCNALPSAFDRTLKEAQEHWNIFGKYFVECLYWLCSYTYLTISLENLKKYRKDLEIDFTYYGIYYNMFCGNRNTVWDTLHCKNVNEWSRPQLAANPGTSWNSRSISAAKKGFQANGWDQSLKFLTVYLKKNYNVYFYFFSRQKVL